MKKGTLYFAAGLALAIAAGTLTSNLLRKPIEIPKIASEPSPSAPSASLSFPNEPVIGPTTPQALAPASPATPAQPRLAASPVPRRGPTQQPTVETPIDYDTAYEALAYVGSDPEAEAVWVKAINDPTFSAKQRVDLIEDLNQTGFDNPRQLTLDDLPLIESRIAIIERLGPDAMDETNSASFKEAYKDLLNMRSRLVRQ